MAIFDWRVRKKLFFFFAAFFIVAGVVLVFIYFYTPEETCFDGIWNQDEVGVDCGGPCAEPCIINPRNIVSMWVRALKVTDGIFEAAALIENPNIHYALSSFRYTFRLYDEDNVLVAVYDGQSFVNPQDRFIIFSQHIDTGTREAQKAFLEIEPLSEWEYVDKLPPEIFITSKTFENLPTPSLSVKIKNSSLFPVKDLYLSTALYDLDENTIGVSSSFVKEMRGEEEREIVFTWPLPFDSKPASSEVFFRTNMTGRR